MHKLPLLFSSCFLAACSSAAPAPDAQPAPSPQPNTNEAPIASQKPAEEVSYIDYNYKDGRTRAYLAFTSPICEEDDTAQPVYEIQALWKYDVRTSQWVDLDVAPDVPYRIACNAMLDLVNVLGYDLEPATYAIEAEIGGTTERDTFLVGDLSCDAAQTGVLSDGQIELCIVGPDSAESRLVPDPALLE